MARLKKIADENIEQIEEQAQPQVDFTVVLDLLERINGNATDIKSGYYSLLENLNALNKEYAGVYNELKVMAKLPNKNTINDIASFKDDIERAVAMLSDTNFLSGLVK